METLSLFLLSIVWISSISWIWEAISLGWASVIVILIHQNYASFRLPRILFKNFRRLVLTMKDLPNYFFLNSSVEKPRDSSFSIDWLNNCRYWENQLLSAAFYDLQINIFFLRSQKWNKQQIVIENHYCSTWAMNTEHWTFCLFFFFWIHPMKSMRIMSFVNMYLLCEAMTLTPMTTQKDQK